MNKLTDYPVQELSRLARRRAEAMQQLQHAEEKVKEARERLELLQLQENALILELIDLNK